MAARKKRPSSQWKRVENLETDDGQALIVEQDEFEQLCERIGAAGQVGFDTEFVSEYTYRPELCLLQFRVGDECVAVDPEKVRQLDSWWSLMTDEATEVIVHGGQAEVRFCLEANGQRPRNLVDTQIAEGLQSRSYPVGYTSLVGRVLNVRIQGKETRTDWRRRPLSPRQISYALEDVRHLQPIWQAQRTFLVDNGRLSWARTEFEKMISDVEADIAREPWTRLSGLHKLSPRELAVARELSTWRDREARNRDKPVRRILRDDLLVDLARRQPSNVSELTATRDMNRSDYRKGASEMLAAVQRAIDLPAEELPGRTSDPRPDKNPDEHVLGQLLGLALANRCAELNVARSLVGTSADLRHLVRWHLDGHTDGPTPRLMQDWRAEVCGDLLTDVLDGRIALRVSDPESDHPLTFEER